MVSRSLLSAIGITVWTAVIVTAAPRAIRHQTDDRIIEVSSQGHGWEDAESCSDLHVTFNDRKLATAEEDKTITKAEAATLRVVAETNGGVQVSGWDQDTYSVKLCKFVEDNRDAQGELAAIKMRFASGELTVSGPSHSREWAAHLLIRAPRAASLDLRVNNGPMSVHRVDGSVKVRATNGPVTVRDCTGSLELNTENGPVTLEGNSGKQSVTAQNGPVNIELNGSSWQGDGLVAHATNGPLTLHLPSGYQSGVLLESDGNGPFSCRASVCNEGRKTWDEDHKRIEFGSGPAVVRLSTVNGPVSVH